MQKRGRHLPSPPCRESPPAHAPVIRGAGTSHLRTTPSRACAALCQRRIRRFLSCRPSVRASLVGDDGRADATAKAAKERSEHRTPTSLFLFPFFSRRRIRLASPRSGAGAGPAQLAHRTFSLPTPPDSGRG